LTKTTLTGVCTERRVLTEESKHLPTNGSVWHDSAQEIRAGF